MLIRPRDITDHAHLPTTHAPGHLDQSLHQGFHVTPEPTLPQYSGACIRGIIPALLGTRDHSQLPDWMPSMVASARQIVLLVLDGLGWEQLQDRRELAPVLAGMQGGPITSVAPTTTATALTSITTGLEPGEHGLVGYRMALAGEVLNVLRWSVAGSDRRRSMSPSQMQPMPPFLGVEVPIVYPAELRATGFSEAHLRGAVPVGWRSISSVPVEIGRLLEEGTPFVYAYYSGIDSVAHERGFGDFYDAELRWVDHLVAEVLSELPTDAVLLVTSDHGQVEVGERILVPSDDLLRHVSLQSGEGRFRWFHSRSGAEGDLLEAAREEFGAVAWVRSRQQIIEEHWLGTAISAPIAARLGDVAVVPHEPVSLFDPDDSGPYELVCRHGSLTPAEVYVPLVAGSRSDRSS